MQRADVCEDSFHDIYINIFFQLEHLQEAFDVSFNKILEGYLEEQHNLFQLEVLLQTE